MLSYIILRAVKIPVTHDEAGTILNYASRSIYSIITYEDPIPNNHLLNTLLIKFSISVLGLNEFACRLPNLIGGFMYLWFGIKISNLFSQKNNSNLFPSFTGSQSIFDRIFCTGQRIWAIYWFYDGLTLLLFFLAGGR